MAGDHADPSSERPSVRAGLIERPRLVATLAERFERRLVVVVAGAGYGKTTLLAQALRDNGLDPRGVDVWVQVGSVDRTPAHLVASLARALAGDPGAADDVEGLADLVLLRAPEEVALVVDDAHRLEGQDRFTDRRSRQAQPAAQFIFVDAVAGKQQP